MIWAWVSTPFLLTDCGWLGDKPISHSPPERKDVVSGVGQLSESRINPPSDWHFWGKWEWPGSTHLDTEIHCESAESDAAELSPIVDVSMQYGHQGQIHPWKLAASRPPQIGPKSTRSYCHTDSTSNARWSRRELLRELLVVSSSQPAWYQLRCDRHDKQTEESRFAAGSRSAKLLLKQSQLPRDDRMNSTKHRGVT